MVEYKKFFMLLTLRGANFEGVRCLQHDSNLKIAAKKFK